MRKRTAESGEASPIPITVRQLEAIVRLSESLARMQLSAVATEAHVAEALRLFNVSTLDAAQSGLTDSLAVSEEQRAEIQQVEAHVRRRMGIGSVLSERALITELVRANLAESTVRRTPGIGSWGHVSLYLCTQSGSGSEGCATWQRLVPGVQSLTPHAFCHLPFCH